MSFQLFNMRNYIVDILWICILMNISSRVRRNVWNRIMYISSRFRWHLWNRTMYIITDRIFRQIWHGNMCIIIRCRSHIWLIRLVLFWHLFFWIIPFFLLFGGGGGDVSDTLEYVLNICSGGFVEKLSKSSSSFDCTNGSDEEWACSTWARSKASISSAVETMFEHAFWMYHNT